MLELYHWEPNAFSLKPLIVLHEKGLDFKSHYVDFLSLAQYSLPVSGTMEVRHNPELDGPILVSNGVAMTESFFISLFLDEAHPEKPLRPADAYGRWQILMWARFVNEVLAPAVSTLGAKKYLVPALRAKDRKAVERVIAEIPTEEQKSGWRMALDDAYTDDLLADSRRKTGLAVKKVEDALAGGEFLCGGGYSLADIDMYAMLAPVADLAPELLAGAPKTKAWLAAIAARPTVKAALATGKTGKPHHAFTPGPEHSRWG